MSHAQGAIGHEHFPVMRCIAVQRIGLAQGGSFISVNSEGLTLISLVVEFTEKKRGANVIGDEKTISIRRIAGSLGRQSHSRSVRYTARLAFDERTR